MTIDMNSNRELFVRASTKNRSNIQYHLTSPLRHLWTSVTHYDTPKVVRFESKWIAILSLVVKLSLAISCSYLMCQRSSYQIFDRSPISAVTIKVKPSTFCSRNTSILRHFPEYNCSQSAFDVNDFITPPTENSAITITTRMLETEHVLRNCDNKTKKSQSKLASYQLTALHTCAERSRCILPPLYRYEYENDKMTNKSKLCWFKSSKVTIKENYQALDYILFIKHFVEFPQLGLVRGNIIPNKVTREYVDNCEFDPEHHPLCPKFRLSKILEMIEKDPDEYKPMFFNGSLIEIKISWKCNLDRNLEYCQPLYEFQRLDIKPYRQNPFLPGSNFLTSRYFFRPRDGELHRIHTNIYNLHILVSVTGEVGRFDLFQTTTSIGSFLGIFGTGTIVCDFLAAFFTNFKSLKYEP